MAEIKVQRKPGGLWWILLLVALLGLVLIWWLTTRAGDDGAGADRLAEAPPAASDPAVPASGAEAGAGAPVTDMNTILTAADARTLIGRDVRLEDIAVQEMVGDAAFWIGAQGGERVLVILDQQIPSPPASVEGRVNVNAGQTVDIRGRMRAATDLPAAAGLEPRERDAARGEQVYIWAESAEVVSPASAAPAGPPGRR